jgi:hypothetical protein
MNLTEQEAAKVIEALNECRNQIEVPGSTYPKVQAALAILQAAKDRPQPAADRLIEAGDAMVAAINKVAYDVGGLTSVWHAAKSAAPAQQAKRLTDEEIGRVALTLYPPDEVNDGCPWYGHRRAIEDTACKVALRYARDNGYLGGLTVEEVMEVVTNALEDHDNAEWRSPPISYNAERDRLLRARLTAKLNSK